MIHANINFLSAFLLGLLSSAHCVSMCGGLLNAFSIASPTASPLRKITNLIIYNAGRITLYTVLGLLMGYFSQFLQIYFEPLASALRLLAGLMLISMGLYVSGWWMGLTYLERGGFIIWKKVQPLMRPLLPATSPAKIFLLGLLWGLLPCGLVYSVLLWALGSPYAGALLFCFGLGTLPALITLGTFTQLLQSVVRAHRARLAAGLFLIIFGIWTLVFNFPGNHAMHDHSTMIHLTP
jgi:sulfite exporter TauE/SafE